MTLSLEDKKGLVKLARKSISLYFDNKEAEKPKYFERFGVFVNIEKNNKVRGSIGFPDPIMPLAQAVTDGARCAAFLDPKFQPLKKEELNEVTFQLSLMTNLHEIKSINEIKLGKHGIIIEYTGYKGLMLPHEYKEATSIEEALSMVCKKADLPEDFWKESPCKITIFESEVYKETEPNGDVIQIIKLS
ncbi:MAG: TIGR00296 family protein [Candidatus Nanoarchaeia archaeon]|nr:TIGR00296 family protein [Candidatus Nanoarchaeia archaeon]